jgi:hypothetical protein
MQIKIVTVDVRLSGNTKRAIRWVILPLVVLAGSMAVAHAYDTTWIASGQPVSATSLKADLDSIQTQLAALSDAGASVQSAVATIASSSAVSVEADGAQSAGAVVVPNTTFVTLPFSKVDWDTLGEYNSNTGFTPVNAGVYQICASVYWLAGLPISSELDVLIDGNRFRAIGGVSASVFCGGCADVNLSAGQHATVAVYQASGSSQTVQVNTWWSYINIHRLY